MRLKFDIFLFKKNVLLHTHPPRLLCLIRDWFGYNQCIWLVNVVMAVQKSEPPLLVSLGADDGSVDVNMEMNISKN